MSVAVRAVFAGRGGIGVGAKDHFAAEKSKLICLSFGDLKILRKHSTGSPPHQNLCRRQFCIAHRVDMGRTPRDSGVIE